MDRNTKRRISMDRNMKPTKGKLSAYAIVRDKHNRIVVSEEVFYDKDRLEKLRQEVLKNGSHSSHSNP